MISLLRSLEISQLILSSPSPFLLFPSPRPALQRAYHAGRASSVNTAIHRGLRKSKGIGFRGPRNPRPEDPREIYRARTGLHPDHFAAGEADSATRRKEARSGPQNEKLARRDSRSSRGITGVKATGTYSSGRPIRSEAILRSEKSGDSEIHGRFGEKLTPRIRKFEHERSRSSRGSFSEANHNPPSSTLKFKNDPDAHTDGRWSRPDSASKAYPSLSFGERSSGQRTPESFESRSRGRHGSLTGGHNPGNFVTRSPDDLAPRASNRPVRPSQRSVKMNHEEDTEAEQPYRKRHDSHSPGTPKLSQVFDKHLPLSIPYTTPASEFLYGTSVVEAAITSRRSPKRKLYKLYILTGENREDAERDSRLERLARKNGVQVLRVGPAWIRLLDKMSSGRPHNGYILEASPLPRLPVRHLGKFRSNDNQEGFEVSVDHQSREEAAVNGTDSFIQSVKSSSGRKPLVLLLDGIVDPGNLGGIIRTASFLGVSAVAISARNSASFTPVVLKASAGASENITLFFVSKPAQFIVDSKTAGWHVYAAVAPSKRSDPSMPASLSTDDLADPLSEAPCILMLGSEGEGLRWNLRSKADVDLYIQGSGQSFNVDSLNVSVATGILCNAFLSKKDGKAAIPLTDELPTRESLRSHSAASTSALF